jgi:sugar-specific transcriptional regulator TrmB
MKMAIEKTEELVRMYDETTGAWKLVKKDKGPLKNVEIIEHTLLKLGLSKNEVRVYLYLARYVERKASEISEALCLHRTETYRILRDLEKRGMVSSVFEKPLKFIATPFEKAIDVLIEAKKLKIKLLERQKKSLVDVWLSLPRPNIAPERKEVFQILEGEEQIDLKADEILENAKKELLMFAPEGDLSRFYYSGFLDRLEKSAKKNVGVMLLTNHSSKSHFFVGRTKLNAKYSASKVEDLPSFIIADKKHLLLSIRKTDDDNSNEDASARRGKIAALWTNYGAFIKALGKLFTELWKTEISIEVAKTTLRTRSNSYAQAF